MLPSGLTVHYSSNSAHPSTLVYLGRCAHVGELVIQVLQAADIFSREDAYPSRGRAGMADGVLAEDNIMMMAAKDYAGPCLSGAIIVHNAVILEDVSMRSHRFALRTEKHA